MLAISNQHRPRGRPQTGQSQRYPSYSKPSSKVGQSVRNKCTACGQAHSMGATNCPARGRRCFECEKMNHFAIMCRNRRPRVNRVAGVNEFEVEFDYLRMGGVYLVEEVPEKTVEKTKTGVFWPKRKLNEEQHVRACNGYKTCPHTKRECPLTPQVLLEPESGL